MKVYLLKNENLSTGSQSGQIICFHFLVRSLHRSSGTGGSMEWLQMMTEVSFTVDEEETARPKSWSATNVWT